MSSIRRKQIIWTVVAVGMLAYDVFFPELEVSNYFVVFTIIIAIIEVHIGLRILEEKIDEQQSDGDGIVVKENL